MTYELECGHCGYRFTLDDGAVTRSVKCVVCGATLTVAVPVPVASEAALPATPVLAPPVPPPEPPTPPPRPPAPPEPEFRPRFPPLGPDRPELDGLEPEERGRFLAPPWPTVCGALDSARTFTMVGGVLYACVVALDLLLLPFVPTKGMTSVGRFLALAAGSLLLPAVMNTICQYRCTFVPRVYGSPWAVASLVTLPLAFVAYIQSIQIGIVLAVTSAAGLVVVAAGIWLRFFTQLAQRLDDRAMMTEAWSYASWFSAGTVVSIALLGCASLGERVGAVPFTWAFKAAVAAIGGRLLWGYAELLRTTTRAIAGRGPVAPVS
ncbi:hypothetical protein [Frigoriglobus tundricola]|uniref:Uncharacterized protein n=1 Tax=Frigoriglobus tundricola TaxID=2774151 RepID=A0A6M5YI99_9BACT|nr:hypothetical protein [Frigoriglobus tundricola]QJW92973.1 hypothetical protein FTUN_0471 [Frigoriglobus tundricola]